MKHTVFILLGSLLFLISCQETTKRKKSSSNQNYYCTGSSYNYPGCPGYNGTTTGSTTSGYTTGSTTSGSTTGSTTGIGYNPYPNYYSGYVDKNWAVHYPFVPSITCTDAKVPTGIDYTPYETRKGSITLKGQVNYDPSSGQPYFDTTSELLQTVEGAKNFFWADSTLKIRFKANLQPQSANTTSVCPGRQTGVSSIKGYGKIRFNLNLVGTRADGTTSTVSLGTREVKVNSCTTAINLSNYAEQFPNGIYLKVSNVEGNQNWAPGVSANDVEAKTYDTYGFVTPQNSYVEGTWKAIRNAECWSLDIEVAADGTKTFN